MGLYSDRTDSCDCLFPTRTEGVTQMQYSADGNYLYVGYRKVSATMFLLEFHGQLVIPKFYAKNVGGPCLQAFEDHGRTMTVEIGSQNDNLKITVIRQTIHVFRRSVLL